MTSNTPPNPGLRQLPTQATLLRIYLGESDRWDGRPLYEAIILKARETGLAGGTVLRSPIGFGASSHLHSAKILQLSTDLPLVIEIVDDVEKIEAFLPLLESMMQGGLIILQEVKVLHYQGQRKEAAPSSPVA